MSNLEVTIRYRGVLVPPEHREGALSENDWGADGGSQDEWIAWKRGVDCALAADETPTTPSVVRGFSEPEPPRNWVYSDVGGYEVTFRGGSYGWGWLDSDGGNEWTRWGNWKSDHDGFGWDFPWTPLRPAGEVT